MTREKQLELVGELTKKLTDIMVSKGEDYATEDVLSNFKRMSAAAAALNLDVRTPYGYALFLSLLKIDRINNLLINSKTPNNEGIDDSFFDGINYEILAYLCYKDKT